MAPTVRCAQVDRSPLMGPEFCSISSEFRMPQLPPRFHPRPNSTDRPPPVTPRNINPTKGYAARYLGWRALIRRTRDTRPAEFDPPWSLAHF
jgi:hypothetical protein